MVNLKVKLHQCVQMMDPESLREQLSPTFLAPEMAFMEDLGGRIWWVGVCVHLCKVEID